MRYKKEKQLWGDYKCPYTRVSCKNGNEVSKWLTYNGVKHKVVTRYHSLGTIIQLDNPEDLNFVLLICRNVKIFE